MLSFALGQKAPQYAMAYSKTSIPNNWLYSIGIDDFVAAYTKLEKQVSERDALIILTKTIENTHSINSRLKFGITIYETDLNSNIMDDRHFPRRLRSKIDLVHFYLGYRRDVSSLERYVDRVSQLFPNAEIVGGLYAYDRQNYVACQPGGFEGCSAKEGLELFLQNVRVDIKLLKSGHLARLEFYPGHLGDPGEWAGWREWRSCYPWRRHTCEENSRAMQRQARELLASGK